MYTHHLSWGRRYHLGNDAFADSLDRAQLAAYDYPVVGQAWAIRFRLSNDDRARFTIDEIIGADAGQDNWVTLRRRQPQSADPDASDHLGRDRGTAPKRNLGQIEARHNRIGWQSDWLQLDGQRDHILQIESRGPGDPDDFLFEGVGITVSDHTEVEITGSERVLRTPKEDFDTSTHDPSAPTSQATEALEIVSQVELHGQSAPMTVGDAMTIATPGLRGTATVYRGRDAGRRSSAPAHATAALEQGLAAAGFREAYVIELDVEPTAAADSEPEPRTVIIQLAPGSEYVGHMALVIDNGGTLSWHLPDDATERRRFELPIALDPPEQTLTPGLDRLIARVPAALRRPLAQVVTRIVDWLPERLQSGARSVRQGSLGRCGLGSFIKILRFHIGGRSIEPEAITTDVRRWERRHRPYGLLVYGLQHQPSSAANPQATNGWRPLEASDWYRLQQKRSLLLIHGTTSTTMAGFSGLDERGGLRRLTEQYAGRVWALNHPTLSRTPSENAEWLCDQVPEGTQLDVDIVCHSRGGLVARALDQKATGRQTGIEVNRIVFVGVPNRGTDVADPDSWRDFLDWNTTVLNLFAPPELEETVSLIEGLALLAVTKARQECLTLTQVSLRTLPGLAALGRDSDYLITLNAGIRSDARDRYHAIIADFELQPGLSKRDALADRLFRDRANDLVVPLDAALPPGIDFSSARVHVFRATRPPVHHCNYFWAPETANHISAWLSD